MIGGGYGGVTAANSLARRDGVSVTLVNPRPHFVSRIRLHQLVTGSDDAVEGFGEVLGGNVRLVVDTATRIDAAARQVSLAGGGTLSYDYLVYAVGSGAADPGVPGAAEFAHWVSDLEGRNDCGRRLMFILETLSPTERAVFVLREVFDIGYDDIAAAIDKSPAAARQISYRARRHVDARRPRTSVSPEETRAALSSFQSALETGNLQGLLDVLAPDVVFVSDGGGLKLAALRPVVGADKVLRYMAGSVDKAGGTFTSERTTVNGNPGLILRVDGVIDGVLAFRVENARVTGLYYVRNPEKLTRVESETPLTSR
ncbi:FAD-dependent oxidoreductase [Streptomyces canus]|uniref:FAD-dependent oxidoreductase n=1 Tax=Streptomyces canus TaxID=58343 RepID=UPI003F4BE799